MLSQYLPVTLTEEENRIDALILLQLTAREQGRDWDYYKALIEERECQKLEELSLTRLRHYVQILLASNPLR